MRTKAGKVVCSSTDERDPGTIHTCKTGAAKNRVLNVWMNARVAPCKTPGMYRNEGEYDTRRTTSLAAGTHEARIRKRLVVRVETTMIIVIFPAAAS
jgi:hypothetical protein